MYELYSEAESKPKKKDPLALKVIAVILAVILVLLCANMAYFFLCLDTYRGTMTEAELPYSKPLDTVLTQTEAYTDFDYFYTTVRERHPAWLDGSADITAAFEAQYLTERESFGATVTVRELYLAAARTASVLHDGHTNVILRSNTQERYINSFAQLKAYGAPLTIDGIPYKELLAAYSAITPSELDIYTEHSFLTTGIVSELYLGLCGVNTSDGVAMTFNMGAGVTEYRYDFVPLLMVEEYDYILKTNGSSPSYVLDEPNNLAIFTLPLCRYDDAYKQTVAEFFSKVNDADITNVAVDLRGNGGGNAGVATEFLRYIDVDEYKTWDMSIRFGWILSEYKNQTVRNNKAAQTFDGKLYVLTDIDTYSSAMDFAMLVGDNKLGVIVGEASGNNPSGYGDFVRFAMENSQLCFIVSTKKWYRLDLLKNGEPLTPDIETKGEDALDKVYELITE